MDIMLTLLKNNQLDCPQAFDQIYFNNLHAAREAGVKLLREHGLDVFCVRRITKIGHYRTLGFFNAKNEYLR